jgi:hypothetical protein
VNASFRSSFYTAALIGVILGLWLSHLWTAENQVRLHSKHLLGKIEKRSWVAAMTMVAEDYHDDWGDDRNLLKERLSLTLREFSSLTISSHETQQRLEPPFGNWMAKIQLSGRGSEAALETIQRLNRLTAPFELRWRKESWRPWDWKLAQVRNASLELPAGFGY